jgi:hypothetical protein
MKALAILNTPKQPPQDERVLELFRNRAELKKAYSELQDEIHALKDRLKQQEGVTARVQEMLQELETRLESPATAFPALVFYSLRRLWNAGNRLLAEFAAELEKQQIDKESVAAVADFNRRRFERRKQLDAAMQAAQADCSAAEQRLAALEAQRIELARPWHYFKRQDLEQRIQQMQRAVGKARLELEPVQSEFAEFEQQPAPKFAGLSVAARRAVNTSLIALAEILSLRLAKTPLVGMAKAASLRRSVSDEFGDRNECLTLLDDVARALAILSQRAPAPNEIKPRIDRIRASARYRGETDCIPLPESLLAPPEELDLAGNQQRPERNLPNVLAEDTWDIFKVLLR